MVVSIGTPESRPEREQGTDSWAEQAFICCQLDPEMGLEAGVLCVFLADVSQATLVAVALGLAQSNTLLAYVHSLPLLQRSHNAFHLVSVLQVLLSVLWSTKPRHSEAGEHTHLSGTG